MGYPKLSAEVPGKGRLGGLALRSALQAGMGPIIVVTKPGDEPPWLAEATAAQGVAVIRAMAAQAELGMAYSIRAGFAEAARYEPRAVLMLLADMPLVTTEMLLALADGLESAPHLDFVAYRRGGRPLPPVLLGASMFPCLKHLEGDTGARSLLQDPRFNGAFLRADREEDLMDVDTWQDMNSLLLLCGNETTTTGR